MNMFHTYIYEQRTLISMPFHNNKKRNNFPKYLYWVYSSVGIIQNYLSGRII